MSHNKDDNELDLSDLPNEILERVVDCLEPPTPKLVCIHQCIEDLCLYGMFASYLGVQIVIPQYNIQMEVKWALFAPLAEGNCELYIVDCKELDDIMSEVMAGQDPEAIAELVSLLNLDEEHSFCIHNFKKALDSLVNSEKDWDIGCQERYFGSIFDSSHYGTCDDCGDCECGDLVLVLHDEKSQVRFQYDIKTRRDRKVYNEFCDTVKADMQCIYDNFLSRQQEYKKLMDDADDVD